MADLRTQVQERYVAYFGRPADVTGLDYWTGVATTRDGLAETVKAFAASAEYQAIVAGMDNRAVVDTVYEHLFGRHAEQAGVDYWAGMLDRQVITVSDVVTSIAGGAQGLDGVVFQAKVDTSKIFTDHLDQPYEMLADSGASRTSRHTITLP
jgi:hypothetical protein